MLPSQAYNLAEPQLSSFCYQSVLKISRSSLVKATSLKQRQLCEASSMQRFRTRTRFQGLQTAVEWITTQALNCHTISQSLISQ